MTSIIFLALTFAISLTGYLLVLAIPGARSPETATGLPFWLLMVWGPSLAAMILAYARGDLSGLLARAVRVATVPVEVWLLILAPLAVLLVLLPFAPEGRTAIAPASIALMVALNLVLGPLGEELGWRGYLQEDLSGRLGWLEASVLVGAVWFAWHLPLWTFDSPHAQITLPLFAAHCMLYAVIIGAAHTLSGGSILPAILLHLTFNLASNAAWFAGFQTPDDWFRASILPYAILALICVIWVWLRTGQSGLRLLWVPQ